MSKAIDLTSMVIVVVLAMENAQRSAEDELLHVPFAAPEDRMPTTRPPMLSSPAAVTRGALTDSL